MALKGRFAVAVTTRFTPEGWVEPDLPPIPPVPPLTESAALFGLEGAALDDELASVRAKRSELAAYEAGLIERKATLGARHRLPLLPGARTDVGGGDDLGAQADDYFLPDEVAVLLRCSVASARHLVADALVLVRQLPDVWDALADGRIDESRARVIVQELRWQAAGVGGPHADEDITALAARAIGRAERGCLSTTLRGRLQAGLVAADPDAADARRETRVRAGDVTSTPTGDGTVDLHATGVPAERAALIRAQLTAYARKLKADGDRRPLGALRVAVMDALLIRPWERPDPGVAHVTITADLRDPVDPDQLTALRDLVTADDPTTDTQATGEQPNGEEAISTGHPAEDDAGPTAGSSTGIAADEPGHASAAATDRPAGDTPSQPETAAPDPSHPEPAAQDASAQDTSPSDPVVHGSGRHDSGGVGDVNGSPVTPAAVRELQRTVDALGLTDPAVGDLTFALTDRGRVLAVASPAELATAARTGTGLGPPHPTDGYTPTAAQYRYLRARDRHCRFPGCRRPAATCDADHVVPYDHHDPATGGPSSVDNLALLCRHHHRLKTHAPGWAFTLDPDGTLVVTTPGGTTLTTRPPGIDHVLDLISPPSPPHDPAADPAPF
ncbi:DUF222 domain-containing protein [Klenkia sp. PcliD-1-E]|uniref:DUF222 domain-containing protein n=1 Tax=Klenkia sp. PcliD-1-E TaxID=2954492 RepID=UPI0020972F78|nr:DUF222 domain-containing protein [Klenkia sp. PcliD-1-E]MCO7220744.1 DUF222 domain-containing protein [Klenkia sp. PcliD-1-E]